MLEVYTATIGGRECLVVGNIVIPVDRIKAIDMNAPNGGSTNSVRIVTDDPDERFVWAYENADAIRDFVRSSAGK